MARVRSCVNKTYWDIASKFYPLDYVDIIQLIFSLEFQVTGCVSKSKDNLDFHIVAKLY